MITTISAYKRGTWGLRERMQAASPSQPDSGVGARIQTQTFGFQWCAFSEINRHINRTRYAW